MPPPRRRRRQCRRRQWHLVGSGRLTNLPLLTIDGSQRSVAKGGRGEREGENANISDDAGNRADADGKKNVTEEGEQSRRGADDVARDWFLMASDVDFEKNPAAFYDGEAKLR